MERAPGLPGVVRAAVAKAHGVFTRWHSPQVGGEDVLRSATQVLTKTGEEFLPAVVREIAAVLGADVAFVGEFTGTDRLRTIAMWRDGRMAENVESALAGTPCEQLADRATMCHARAYVTASLGTPNWPQSVRTVTLPCRSSAHVTTSWASWWRLHDGRSPTKPAEALLQLVAGRVAAELERARTERELRKSEHHLLQVQRVEAIGWLAGNIAHDFNNLLMIVIGYAEILQDRGASQEMSELLAAAKRASTLTKQLLAFGRRQVMQVQRVDINRVVIAGAGDADARDGIGSAADDDARPVDPQRRSGSRAARTGARQPGDQRA